MHLNNRERKNTLMLLGGIFSVLLMWFILTLQLRGTKGEEKVKTEISQCDVVTSPLFLK